MQGEQQEAGELRRLHLRLERANEHVNQLQSRLASQASSDTSCSHQLAEAQRAQQAQQLEIESLQRQLAGSQASSSNSGSKEEELEAQHAQQQLEIKALRRQLQEQNKSGSLDRDQQLEGLKAEIAKLQEALAKAANEATGPSTQTGAEAKQHAVTSDGTAAANGGKQQSWKLDCEPAQWCQLAWQDRTTFCDQLALLQQELKAQRAEFTEREAGTVEQKATITEQKASLAQQDSRLAQAAADLADKTSALHRCSEEVAMLESKLTDCKSVTSLQSEQLAVLQSEVDQLRCSLAAAEKLAGGSATDEQLRQEVKELRSRLQVRQLQSEHRSGLCVSRFVGLFGSVCVQIYLAPISECTDWFCVYACDVLCDVLCDQAVLCLMLAKSCRPLASQ